MDETDKLNILIVEDETIIALDISQTLAKLGFSIAGCAISVDEALGLMEEKRPDLILIDIVLKGPKDGIEFAREVKERFQIPFIYMTANADMATIHRARDTEPYGYVLKPVSWRELYSNIDSAIHRHRTERRLRESEEKFNKAFHASPLVMSISTVEEGRLVEVNESFLRNSGYSREEVIGRTSLELNLFVDPDERRRAVEKCIESGFVKNIDMKVRSRSGEIRYGLISTELLSLQGKRYFLMVMNDVTDRRRVEQELADTTAMLETAFDVSPIPMVLVTVPDAIIRVYNRASVEILGMQDEPNYVGKSLFEVKQTWKDFDEVGNEVPMAELPLAKAVKGISTKNRELSVFRKDGTRRWELVSGRPIFNNRGEQIAAFIAFPDITELKMAEAQREAALESLRASEERYRVLFTTAAEGILVADAETRRFYHANPAVCSMFGYTEEEMLCMRSDDIHPAADLASVLKEFGALARKEKTRVVDIPCLRKDGTVFLADISAAHLTFDGKHCLSGFFTVHEILAHPGEKHRGGGN